MVKAMAYYSFFPHTARGLALMFETDELANDDAARAHAAAILRDHESAVEVQVWREDRLTFTVRADEPRSWVEGLAGPIPS